MKYAVRAKRKYNKKSKNVRSRIYKLIKRVYQKPMVNAGQGFPKKMLMTHRYSECLLLTSASGVLATYNWVANGMFDPNQTGTGHQPMYFDQMAAIYDHYTVIGAKLTVKISNVVANIGARCGIFINDDTVVTPSFVDALRERNPNVSRIINNGSNNVTTMTIKWSGKKTFGKYNLTNPSFIGTAAANPTEQSIFTFFIQPIDASSTQNYYVEYLLEQIAVWTELKDIASS